MYKYMYIHIRHAAPSENDGPDPIRIAACTRHTFSFQ